MLLNDGNVLVNPVDMLFNPSNMLFNPSNMLVNPGDMLFNPVDMLFNADNMLFNMIDVKLTTGVVESPIVSRPVDIQDQYCPVKVSACPVSYVSAMV
jgi:hypothetical protein